MKPTNGNQMVNVPVLHVIADCHLLKKEPDRKTQEHEDGYRIC